MLAHENTDISIATIGLLQEMLDLDAVVDEKDSVLLFIKEFIRLQGLELLIQNLYRLDVFDNNGTITISDEDAEGIQNTLIIIENLIELDNEIANTITEKTKIFSFLLNKISSRTNSKKFDTLKLNCVEILSILLQTESKNIVRVCTLEDIDAMELILQAIAVYRKKDPESADEEVKTNITGCRTTLLLFIMICSFLSTYVNFLGVYRECIPLSVYHVDE